MTAASSRTSGLVTTLVLARRELVRFKRQPARIGAAIGTPLILWVFMVAGFSKALESSSLGDMSYDAFLLPGTMTLVAMFASIFGSISVIEDRHDGWLRTVLASPAPRWSIATGKVGGGAIVALLQAMMLIPMFFVTGTPMTATSFAQVFLALVLTCIAMTSVGIGFAWKCETSSGFHAVMNLVLMPMWLLSGAFFPAGETGWLSWVIRLNRAR